MKTAVINITADCVFMNTRRDVPPERLYDGYDVFITVCDRTPSKSFPDPSVAIAFKTAN